MSGQTLPILLNQKAGALRSTAGAQEMERLARAAGLSPDVLETSSGADMRRRIAQLIEKGHGRLAVAGGDGTVHNAVQALAHKGVALGIIPQGTANNFATALGLPPDLPSALELLAAGEVRDVDLGKVCGEFFTESAGVGLFADALALYGVGTSKNIWRGLKAVARLVLALRASRIKLTIDGEKVIERAVMCTAANTYRMGYAVPVAPEADATDSQLDLVILGDLTRRELVTYFRAMKAQLHGSLPKVQMRRARKVVIDSSRKMLVHADDRLVCNTPATIEVQPRALKVIVPRA